MKNKFTLSEKAAEGSFVLQNQKPGKIVNGKFVEIDVSALSGADKKRFEDDLKRYTAERERRYGKGQLQKDLKTSQRVESEQEAKRKAAADAKRKGAQGSQGSPGTGAQGAQGSARAGAQGAQGSTNSEPPTRQPAPPRQPAPQPARQESPVAKYMTAAAAARKSGDPAEMAKVRDMGMEIWRKSNPKLAAAADERERIRGTAQSDNPLLDKMGLRSGMRAGSPTVQSPTLERDLGNLAPNYTRLTQNPNAGISPTPKPAPAQAPGNEKPGYSGPPTPGTETAPVKPPKKEDKPVKKEAYDIVLDYLFSEGHVDTLSEAHYVMMQMDAEHIQSIVLQERAWWDPAGVFTKTKKTYARLKPARAYNPISGTTFGRIDTGVYKPNIIVSRGGVMGAMEKGKPQTFGRIDPSDPDFKSAIERYRTLRGETQLQKDKEAVRASRIATLSPPDSRLDSPIAGPGPIGNRVGSKPVPAPAPAAAPPPKPVIAPTPKPVVAPTPTPDAPAPKLSKMQQDILDLRQMRANSLNRQGDIAGAQKLQTEIDMARVNNKMAATSPTPDAKPASSEVLKRFNKASADYSS